MNKFSELCCLVKQMAKQHTRAVLSQKALAKEEKLILKKWGIVALKLAKKAKTVVELKRAKDYAPSGSEAETLATKKLDNLTGNWA